MKKLLISVLVVSVFSGVMGCESKPKEPASPPPAPTAEVPKEEKVAPPESKPISEERIAAGRKLVMEYECSRCHLIEDVPVPKLQNDCVGCHVQILAGTYEAEPAHLEKWQKNIKGLKNSPNLVGVGKRLNRDWLIEFLRSPHELRPRLEAEMPILNIGEKDAQAIADFLLKTEVEKQPQPKAEPGQVEKGKALANEKGCWTCHAMDGVEGLKASAIPVEMKPEVLSQGMLLAPDLGHAAKRFRTDQLTAWLLNPSSVKPDALMPNVGLTESEAAAIGAFLMETKTPESKPGERVAIQGNHAGPATYKDVQRVFDSVCVHCHADPAHAAGDGGPGNTGGFGFKGQGLDLTTYSRIRMGSMRRKDDRAVVKVAEGAPSKLVVHLIERHNEVNGLDDPEVLGMPLGHAPLPMADIELIHAWTAAGARPK